jgi:prolyl-tRNA synthetase
MEVATKLAAELGAYVDVRDGMSPGAKFFHWERRGVPVVFELGPRDVASGNIVIKRRDTGTKEVIPQTEAVAKLASTLDAMQKDLYSAAKQRLKDNTVTANSIQEVESILNDVTAERGGGKFVMAHLTDDPKNDARIKEFRASVRNIPLVDEFDGPGKCILTGETVDRRVVISKSY